jgi:ribosome-binding factor A
MSHRYEQVGREILRGISQIVHEELPLDQYGLITITEVEVGPGYESAKIYFTTLKNAKPTEDILNKKSGWFGKKLRQKIVLRRMPQLQFVHDERIDRFERIQMLIDEEEKKNK